MSANVPAGRAGGAFAGNFPDSLALGFPNAMGYPFFEDFVSLDEGGQYGDRRWVADLSGATGTAAKELPISSTEDEFGVLRLQVTTSGNRITLHQGLNNDRNTYWRPAPGTIFVVKVRMDTSATSSIVWAGFAGNASAPDNAAANSVDFIGVRRDTGLGTAWHGVIRSGTSDTVQTMTVTAAVSAYQVLGFERLAGGSWQFFTLDVASRRVVARTNRGSPIAVDPSDYLTPVIGVQSSAAGTKGAVFDYLCVGGRSRRN